MALAGCLGVTETGVHYLLTNCSDLKSLDLTATNVMMLPSQIVGKDVDMAGCPLISPIESYLEQKGLDGLKGKILVMFMFNATFNNIFLIFF